MAGTLYVVATPIGNLGDITYRAVEVLKMVDAIACENRDRNIKLLNHLGLKKWLLEYSPANEKNSAKGIVDLLLSGKNIALVSDAGMPNISDPGRVLVQEALKAGIKIVPIPGISALTTVLSVSPFPAKRVAFLGFLPKSQGKLEKELLLFKSIEAEIVAFVSKYQIKKFLLSVKKIFGNAEIMIGREMTKLNEEYRIGKVDEILQEGIEEKGEFTVVIYNRI